MSRISSWCRTTDISANTTITFDSQNVLNFNELSVVIDSDRNGKLTLEQGIDNSNFQFTEVKHTYASKPVEMKFPVNAQYARLKYENSAALDTAGFKMASYGTSNGNSNIYNSDDNILLADNIHVAAGGSTDAANIRHLTQIEVFGSVPTAYTLNVQYSADSSSWFNTIHTATGASGDYHMSFASGAKYLRLYNAGADVSLQAIVAGKF